MYVSCAVIQLYIIFVDAIINDITDDDPHD